VSSLLQIDQQIFKTINSKWTNDFFDSVMPVIREKTTWIPLYIILLLLLIWKYKINSMLIILVAVATAVLTDQLSSSLIKPMFERLRPCNDPSFNDQVRLLINCGVGFSFTSSHAANHFGLAVFFIALIPNQAKWIAPIGIFWAASICYAQVYVGVHYPSDVLGGAVLGSLIGIITGISCKKLLLRKFPFRKS